MSDMIRFNVDMSALSSMKTGGVAETAFFPNGIDELIDAVKGLFMAGTPFHVLGKLSNVLIPDHTVPFVPVVTTGVCGTRTEENGDEITVYAECGASLTPLAMEMCKKGYAGMTFAYGIPGTVGGAVFMNAGAYGGEMKDIVKSVDFYDIASGERVRIPAKECGFGYRKSVFADMFGVILGAELTLTRGNAETLVAEAKETMQKRVDKQPLDYPSCGSAFKRPEGYFAGKLIEDSGLRGFTLGGAAVSEKHCGFVINKGGATTADVLALLDAVKEKVKADSGVTLEAEIRVLS